MDTNSVIPKSACTGIAWPALPLPPAALSLAMQYQLGQSEWWPEEQLRAEQLRQLEHLLNHAYQTIPIYHQRLTASGYHSGNSITPDFWQKIPVLTRDEVQASGEDLFCRKLPREHGVTFEIMTSGSTGKPVRVLGTEVTRLFWDAFTIREHLWQRRDFTRKQAVIRHIPDAAATLRDARSMPNWGSPAGQVFETGSMSALPILVSVEEQIRWLRQEQPHYLLTHATNALALAEHCLTHGIELPSLREVRTFAESLPATLRQTAREAWDATVVDMYSTREAGYLALQCPKYEHYHVQSEGVFLEVLDETGMPCVPGQVGRVVVTALHNFATPLIRYEIGDYAEVGEPCPCGRGLPVIKRVLGRVRNMLTLPNGQSYWPSLPAQEYREAAPILQYQLVQTELDHIEVRLVTTRPVINSEQTRLAQIIQEHLRYPFRLTFRYLDKIERSASGKFEEFRSEIEP